MVTAGAVLYLAAGADALEFSAIPSFDSGINDKREHAVAGNLPGIAGCDTVYPGLPFTVYTHFSSYARNAFGYVDIAYSCSIVAPGGRTVADTAGIVAYSGIMPGKADVLPGGSNVSLSIPRHCAPGRYRLIVTARDEIDETVKTVEKQLVLAKFPTIKSVNFDVVSFNVWVHNYCIAPDPARAVPAFSWFIASDMSNNDDMFWGVFYFFQCLFNDNPALVDELLRGFGGYAPRLREYTVFLLRAMSGEKTKAAAVIPDSLWHAFDNAAQGGFLDPLAVTFTIGSVRLLEFGFYYYGSYSMARLLFDCLGLETETGYAAFIANGGRYCKGCARSIDRKTARQLNVEAKNIVSKAYAKHALVNAYCRSALTDASLNPDARSVLREIVAAAGK
jgi:hypothetical protein